MSSAKPTKMVVRRRRMGMLVLMQVEKLGQEEVESMCILLIAVVGAWRMEGTLSKARPPQMLAPTRKV